MTRREAMWPQGPSRPGTLLTAAGRAVRTMLRDPVIAILLLAGVAEVLAGDPLVDWLVLVLTAAALAWDRIRRRRLPDGEAVAVAKTGQWWVDRLVPARLSPALVVGGLVYVTVAGGLDPFSWPALVAVAAPGLVGVLSAWQARPTPSALAAPIHAGGAAAWAAIFVVLALWELSALLLQPSLTTGSPLHPTISVLLDPALGSHLGRSAGFAVWLALGWSLVRR